MVDLTEIIKTALKLGASDIHLRQGLAPTMRVGGVIVPYKESKRVSMNDITAFTQGIMAKHLRDKYNKYGDITFSTKITDCGRFRVSCFKTRLGMALALRPIPREIPTLEELGMPESIKAMTLERRGVIFVSGAAGSGKSSTVAAMLEHINKTRPGHIITIESPVEFHFRGDLCLFDQREVGMDTSSIQAALKHILMEDPDVIMISGIFDHEVARAVLCAAEAGPLVIAQVNTSDASDTVMSYLNHYPAYLHRQTRMRLSVLLKGIISQRLIPSASGSGRVPAVEILTSTHRIRECIKDEEKFNELGEAITASGPAFGMKSFDQSLMELLRKKEIAYEEALMHCSNPQLFSQMEEANHVSEGDAPGPGSFPADTGNLPPDLKEQVDELYRGLMALSGGSKTAEENRDLFDGMKQSITKVSEMAGGEKKNFQKNLAVISSTLEDLRAEDLTQDKAKLIAQGLYIVVESWELD